MRRLFIMICLVSCIGLGVSDNRAAGQAANGIRLESVTVKRVDHDHFRAVVKLVNETDSDIYIQATMDRSSTPYPLYLERRIVDRGWQIVAPCADSKPAGAIVVRRGGTLSIDRVQSLDLPSNCRIRRIDPSGEYRWRIEYFRRRADVKRYEETEGRDGTALSAFSESFSIKLQPAEDQRPN
jgi:hypothetical protein